MRQVYYDDGGEYKFDVRVLTVRNAIIEECAQIADQLRRHQFDDASEIAAAIRKLKTTRATMSQWAKIGFSREHWFTLPLSLRQLWWRETNYNTNPPSPELLSAIKNALK